MSKVLRILCLIVVFAMVITVSACTGTNKSTTAASTGETTTGETTAANPFAEHLELSVMGGSFNDATIMSENKLVQLALEEKFNVSFTFSVCPYYNDPNGFNLIVQAGVLPDWGFTCLTVKGPQLYEQGLTQAIKKADVERLCPEYTKKMVDRPLMLAWQTLSDTEYYGLYQIGTIDNGGGFTTALRLDWMENLGIAPKGNVTRLVAEGADISDYGTPDTVEKDKEVDSRMFITDAQYTWDEFVAILEKFVNSDPDQNGKKDTYGLSGNLYEFMNGYWQFHIFPVDGMNFRWVREADKSAAPQDFSVAFKTFLEMHKALADKGLMVPEYWSAGVTGVWDFWSNGQAGAIGVCEGYVGPASLPPYTILYNNTSAKVLLIPPTQGRASLDASFMGGSDIGLTFINAKCDQAKYERILSIFDYICADDAGRVFSTYGVEGQNYTKDATTGVITANTAEQNEKLPAEKRVAVGAWVWSTWYYWTPAPAAKPSRLSTMVQYGKDKWPAKEGYYVFFGPGAADALAKCEFSKTEHDQEKNDAVKQYIIDICTGATDSNTAYEKLISFANGIGYQEYLKAVNDSMYITSELQKGNLVHPSEVVGK